jgi:hypothetical protein
MPMRVKERLQRFATASAARPFRTLGVVAALALAGGLLALSLQPNAGSDTFVNRSSPSFQATADDHQHFGGDAVIVLIREPLPDLVQTKDLATESQLEACLAGQVLVANQTLGSFTPAAPGTQRPYGGWASPCGQLTRMRSVQVVYGPGTFLNRAVAAVNTQIAGLLAGARNAVTIACHAAAQLALARHLGPAGAAQACRAASQLAYQQQLSQLEQTAVSSGITGLPRIDSAQFIRQVVFDQTKGVDQPKSRFAYLVPTAGSALIQARLKPNLSSDQQARTISLIRRAVRMPIFRLGYGGTYIVTGVPVVTGDLASTISGSIATLLIAALLVMAVTLLVVFRSRLRLLPLGIALAAAGITFGLTSLLGGTLTMASIAVLPILIGLAVDYAIQFQSRIQEARAEDSGGPMSPERAVARAAMAGLPTIAIAALATGTGFLVLQLSPVPMVRGFGLLLVVGIAVALVCAVAVGSAAMALGDHDGARVIQLAGASLRGAAEIIGDWGERFGARVRSSRAPLIAARLRDHGTALGRSALGGALRHPGRILAVAGLLAVLGWVADTQTSVQSDVTKLVPSSMPALRALHTLERVTGVSGEIDVVVHAPNVASPRSVGWMLRYEDQLLTHYGYLETKGCSYATLCPAFSLPDLFCSGVPTQSACSALTASNINTLLAAVPQYFSQAVITPDHREATLAFGIRLMPLARQQRVIDYMRSQLRPPTGISAQLAGIPVEAAQANADLSSSSRRLLTLLAGVIAVALVLLAVFRRAERALVPVIPIALATGWSSLILFLIGIPLNPMSAALGTLVIAISTEFSVLLSERFRQERAAGHELPDALRRAYRSTGAAVLASGLTAIMGFAVLILSSITMLRDFGFVTLIDLSVSLAGVLVVLPAVLVLSERGELAELVRQAAAWGGSVPRPRRRARVA